MAVFRSQEKCLPWSIRIRRKPSRRRSRGACFGRSVRWLLVSVVIVVVGGLLCLPSLLATPERVSRLIATSVPELRGDVTMARVGVGWFGPIVVDDIQIRPRNGEPTPVTIRRVEVGNGLAGVLLSLGDLGRVRIEGLQADIVFDREHRSNLDAILPPDDVPPAADAGGGDRGGAEIGKRASGPRRAAVRLELDVVDAIVRINGPWTADPWISDPIDVRARLANAADGYGEWTVEPVQLLQQAELQQTVAHEVLAYIVPVLADSANQRPIFLAARRGPAAGGPARGRRALGTARDARGRARPGTARRKDVSVIAHETASPAHDPHRG